MTKHAVLEQMEREEAARAVALKRFGLDRYDTSATSALRILADHEDRLAALEAKQQ